MKPLFGFKYQLLLTDGSIVIGTLIKNDLVTEMVWLTETGGFVFECEIQIIIGIIHSDSVLSYPISKKHI
jgi:hypothetical protein